MASPYSFFKYHKFIIMAAGKWQITPQGTLTAKLYEIYRNFVELYCFLMTQNMLLSMWMFRNCHERIVELCCYYVQYTNVNIMAHLTKTKRMRQVFNCILMYETKDFSLKEQKIYSKYAKLNRNVGFLILTLTLIAAVIWYTLGTKNTYQDHSDKECLVEKGLSFQVWYPFDLYNEHFWFTVTADLTLLAVMMFSLTFIRSVTVVFMIFVLGQMKILQNMIKSMDESIEVLVRENNVTFKEATLEVIVSCVKKHQEIEALVALVNEACKEFVLIGFFSNSMELALFLMKLLIEDSLMGVFRQTVVLLMTLTQLFLFLWFANSIKVESSAISDIIYHDVDWLSYDKRARQYLLKMMMRSQKPMTCYSSLVGEMTIDTFKNMLKLCYTITTFFRATYVGFKDQQ